MPFEPIGGFPPIMKKDDATVSEKSLETRGFETTSIVNISDIMKNKKKENLYIAFGSEDEEAIGGFLDTPHEYDEIESMV